MHVVQLDFGEYWQRDDSGEYGWLPRGVYTLQVRAVDPAGNKDIAFVDGVNQYTCVAPLLCVGKRAVCRLKCSTTCQSEVF